MLQTRQITLPRHRQEHESAQKEKYEDLNHVYYVDILPNVCNNYVPASD